MTRLSILVACCAWLALGLVAGQTLAASRSAVPVIPSTATGARETEPGRLSEAPSSIGPDLGASPSSTVTAGRSPSPVSTPAVSPVGLTPVSGYTLTGIASWYCCMTGYPMGLYAAAGPELRVGHWRGRKVTVCGLRCIPVTLIDWMGANRLIDLYRSPFQAVCGSLSKGLCRVTVSW